jgi:hypothetical protein
MCRQLYEDLQPIQIEQIRHFSRIKDLEPEMGLVKCDDVAKKLIIEGIAAIA